MMMRDRSVVVPLGKPVMRVEALGLVPVVLVHMRGDLLDVMRMVGIRRRGIVVVGVHRTVLNVVLKMVPMVEHRTGKAVGRMLGFVREPSPDVAVDRRDHAMGFE
jgi:hypothetical protein